MEGVAVEHQYSRTPPMPSTETVMAALPPKEASEKRELPHHPMLSTAALLNPIIEKTPPPLVAEPVPLHPHSQAQRSPQPQSLHSQSTTHSLSRSPVEMAPSASTTPPREPIDGSAMNDAAK
ncbi:hypothetical protein BBK36DRAFT_1161833 [Trichoderma citrinoviride]|uniref:Uncharacterized protein n=1 Tax=Trichoderma citrinoviride TaxID=58853 RepID=A0A2T4B3K8_9HYPO|nr:hypothetical protein BBK36DRAFT_1161833 [Trichoderma citrinoviride]PTB63890.1 hypothetical protein BBK36DRAFT_1161833 [Trichoderma citrinoviride]